MGNSSRFYMDIMAFHKEVTGSCILNVIKFPDGSTKKVLIDCGLFQESKYSELNKVLPFNASSIDYVLVTHTHADHIGKLPYLINQGYHGNIHMSQSASKLISNALHDNYNVLKNNAKMLNEPQLYTDEDVEQTLNCIKPHDFEESFQLDKNIKVTFFMNGHLPGAVIILMQIKYHDSSKYYEDINVMFTGDYNNKNMFFDVKPIPRWVHQLPISIIQEATYGDMNSTDIDYVFERNMFDAISSNGKILIPAFSLGRAQEIPYVLKLWQDSGKLDKSIRIGLTGKLAMKYTEIFLRDGLDNREECRRFLPVNFDYVTDPESRASFLNDEHCSILISTSGMGSNGPCRTLIPEYLRNPNALIHFTGYCAEGTMGRRLHDCEKGEIVDCCGLKPRKLANVLFTSEFSAHAKADELIDFLRPFKNLKLVLVNHGEVNKKDVYANRVVNEIDPKNVGILGGEYSYRIDGYGLVKTLIPQFR